jgi:transketolase
VLNGMALHGGWRVFGATFLIFSDYMKPAIRLAALMELPVIYVFTHDSIGVGEDGPTHQPIEQLAGLRAIPGLCVLRPADAAETTEAWRVALERHGPTALVLTRQALPVFERAPAPPGPAHPGPGHAGPVPDRAGPSPALAPAAGLRRGGYVLRECPGARVTLLATGSEVELALAAADLLDRGGTPTRVVSLPSWDLFQALPAAERALVLGPGTTRVAVEAAASMGWERWVGEGGACVTLDRFGASAPAARLFQELGFTAEHVAQTALEALKARAGLG